MFTCRNNNKGLALSPCQLECIQEDGKRIANGEIKTQNELLDVIDNLMAIYFQTVDGSQETRLRDNF